MAPQKKFTDEMKAWVVQNVNWCSYAELTTRFNERFGTNVGEKSLRGFCARNGLKSGRRVLRINWTTEHLDWIREHVPGRNFDELAEMFRRHFNMQVKTSSFKGMCHRNGLHNGMRGYNEPTRRTQFKPKTAPWNKGTKGVCKANSGSFHRGIRVPKQREVGALTWREQDKAWFIKTAEPSGWRMAAHVVWERAHGRKLEPRMVVIHADGDKNNLAPENLVALKPGEFTSMCKNGLRVTGDADLTRCGAAWVKLRFAVKRLESEGRQD